MDDLETKTIGKLYRRYDELSETEVITVKTYVWRNETRIMIQFSRISDYFKKAKKEKHFNTVVIHENQYNDFVDLLRNALDQCANYIENECG